MIEESISVENARALLRKDQVNRVERVAKKGGLLSRDDRKRLRIYVNKAAKEKKPAPLKEKKPQGATKEGTKFEGTFAQKQRRRKVYELRLRNYTIREMAAKLETSTRVIQDDLQTIDEALTKAIDPTNATAIINETLMDLEAVRLMAMEALPDTEGNERNGLLNTITKATEVKIALLQDAGTLPKATLNHKLMGPDGGPLPAGVTNITHIHVSTTATETQETKRLRAELPGRYEIVDVSGQ